MIRNCNFFPWELGTQSVQIHVFRNKGMPIMEGFSFMFLKFVQIIPSTGIKLENAWYFAVAQQELGVLEIFLLNFIKIRQTSGVMVKETGKVTFVWRKTFELKLTAYFVRSIKLNHSFSFNKFNKLDRSLNKTIFMSTDSTCINLGHSDTWQLNHYMDQMYRLVFLPTIQNALNAWERRYTESGIETKYLKCPRCLKRSTHASR